MRNGNTSNCSANDSAFFNVLILPMRNGNEEDVESMDDEFESSYPTYEEWKLSLSERLTSRNITVFLSYL